MVSKKGDLMLAIKLGKYLKKERVKTKLTQQDVSKYFGYSTPQFVSNWERGLVVPPMRTLKTLCQIYGSEAPLKIDDRIYSDIKCLLVADVKIRLAKAVAQ